MFLANSGTTYYIAVAGKTSGAFGSFTLAFTDAFPPNDDLADAQVQNGPGIATGTTVGATGEPNENVPVCTPSCSPAPLNSVWYRYTASMTGSVTIDTCTGTTYDSILAAYTGTGYPLTQVVANDDTTGCGPSGLQSRITFAATQGSEFYIQVDSHLGNTGAFTLTFMEEGPPPLHRLRHLRHRLRRHRHHRHRRLRHHRHHRHRHRLARQGRRWSRSAISSTTRRP